MSNNTTIDSLECFTPYEEQDRIIIGIIALPLIFIGLIANFISLRIFLNKLMRQQMLNWYLMIISMSDSGILIGAFFVLTFPRLSESLLFSNGVKVCYYATPFMFGVMTISQTISVWMNTVMSLHRFIGVCLPFRAGSILTTENVKKVIGGVLICATIFNISRFFEVIVDGVCYAEVLKGYIPHLTATALRLNSIYRMIFYEWSYTLFMFVIPFTILIVVNTMVIFAVHRSRKIHAKLNMYGDDVRRQELAKEISTSIMLVAIVLAFLFCNTLALIVNILEKIQWDELVIKVVPFSNLLVIINSITNLCIYCLFSDKYRQLFWFYIRCMPCRGKKGQFEAVFNVQ
ncbi:FMRFamide receptor [Strongyloides ratti]|uniref:FMRFamide receptor n=1 Tax=Strongyloides ratti TaxID=34506 RepID=A0A090KP81_STRRB|nr:FMRFamide receptor [Strongyloides ratti]CEF59408.1 FMRFamide receptor [Strongyloides ratti]